MNVNPISPVTMVHLAGLFYCWPGLTAAFDAEDHEYDLYDSFEDELDHQSTTASPFDSYSIEGGTRKQIENVTTHSPFKLDRDNSSAANSTLVKATFFNSTSPDSGAVNATTVEAVTPSKPPVTPKVDAGYFTSGYPKSPTTKRSALQVMRQSSDPNELICLRYSRSNCDATSQQDTDQAIQVRAGSVWHCLSTKQSPACICTCDGTCDPVFGLRPVNSSAGTRPPRIDPTVAGGQVSLPCSDCSCLYLPNGPGSCLCTPGCG